MSFTRASLFRAGLLNIVTLETCRSATALRSLQDRKSTRLNSSHANISYAAFCLKKKLKLRNDRAAKHQKHNEPTEPVRHAPLPRGRLRVASGKSVRSHACTLGQIAITTPTQFR